MAPSIFIVLFCLFILIKEIFSIRLSVAIENRTVTSTSTSTSPVTRSLWVKISFRQWSLTNGRGSRLVCRGCGLEVAGGGVGKVILHEIQVRIEVNAKK